MKYFLDTEFIEGFHKPLFGKRRHFIDLISIGIVAEDGREYSAISSEYRYKDANRWVRDNVIAPLYMSTVHGDARTHIHPETFHKQYGKSNAQIAKEIVLFVNPIRDGSCLVAEEAMGNYRKLHNVKDNPIDRTNEVTFFRSMMALEYARPDFYSYYADYDWVLLCSLFGTMMDLPDGFPMYCIDLKQMLDGKVKARYKTGDNKVNFDRALEHMIDHPEWPKNEGEHDALKDARWNKNLYHFLID